ncbi:MAG TPA: hypothetical protein VHX86_10565 [Tepidisphaeraceae bacterium]|jgi:hypothetical protein|nr:hypothetical protein [Tepidisphaeraceae bacterium]
MPENSKSGVQIKLCTKCGVDVSSQRRIKDPSGRYYCANCGGDIGDKAAANSAIVNQPDRATIRAYGLVSTVTCPHCWHDFAPHDVMWIAAHSELRGDPVLGVEQQRRFVPTRFTTEGQAIDARGVTCQQLACPRCHLTVPRSNIEADPMFLSLVGGPKTGKSYLLAALTWELRRRLPIEFALVFNDVDTETNQHLNDYEATLFLADDPDKLVAIAKTEETGHQYDQATIGGHTVSLPRPFLFNLRPTSQHFQTNSIDKISRVICLYDNAGESFQPGKDGHASPATQHLAKSRALMFLFDPTQDSRFREKCRNLSGDPQLAGSRGTQRQETLLIEMGTRVRRYANLPPNKKHNCPLLVLVPKSDVWGALLGEDVVTEPILPRGESGSLAVVDIKRVERVSQKLRALLLNETPEIIAVAEDFCHHVVYIPVSALGGSPEESELPDGGKGLFVRPKNISPRWVTVPILYMFAKWTTGLIGSNIGSGVRPLPTMPPPKPVPAQ